MKNEWLQIRVSSTEKDVIRRAAGSVNMTLSEFILFTVVNQANKILAKKKVIANAE